LKLLKTIKTLSKCQHMTDKTVRYWKVEAIGVRQSPPGRLLQVPVSVLIREI